MKTLGEIKRQDREVFWAIAEFFYCAIFFLLMVLMSGCAAQKPKAAIPTQQQPVVAKPVLVCHADGTYREATPTGAFLWKYTRIQRVFGVKCERRP